MPVLSLPNGPVRSLRRRPLPAAAIALVLLSLAGAACDPEEVVEERVQELPEVPLVDPVDAIVDSPQVSSGPTLGVCDARPRWTQTEASLYVYDNSFLGITPNEGLVLATDAVGGSGAILRVDDGAVVAQGALSGLIDVDAQWRRRLDHLGDHIAVRDLITSEELAFVGGEDMWSSAGALSPDGGRVATVRCSEGVLHLNVRDVDAVTTVWEAPLDATLQWCPGWSDVMPMVAFGPSEDVVVVGVPTTGAVHIVDIANETETITQVHVMPEAPPLPFVDSAALLDMAIGQQGALLVTTGGDGLLRRFKLPGMVPAGDPIGVGAVAVNLSVYAMPRMASPVAISPDGAVIAAITPWVLNEDMTEQLERSVPVLLDASTGEELGRLDIDLELQPEAISWDDADRTVGLAFSPSGRALVGRLGGGGLALWACDGFVPPAAAAPLAVLLDGPRTVSVGQEVTFTATHLGSDALHAHTFYLDGEMLWGRGGLGRTATFAFAEAGEHEVSVVIDDGATTGMASMPVSVAP
jgi:hypothetical protein